MLVEVERVRIEGGGGGLRTSELGRVGHGRREEERICLKYWGRRGKEGGAKLMETTRIVLK